MAKGPIIKKIPRAMTVDMITRIEGVAKRVNTLRETIRNQPQYHRHYAGLLAQQDLAIRSFAEDEEVKYLLSTEAVKAKWLVNYCLRLDALEASMYDFDTWVEETKPHTLSDGL